MGDNAVEGAIIVAGMLGQFLEEGYNFQICDESYWGQDCINSTSCSCGQFGNDYTNGSGYTGSPLCDLDTSMTIDSTVNKNNSKYSTGNMKCSPTENPGCCWWGRGPVQLTGRHNMKMFDIWLNNNVDIFGKLPSNSSICSNPGIICEINSKTGNNASMVWLGSLFYWITSVQTVPEFKPAFKNFVSQIQKNGLFPSFTLSDLNNNNPVSWPSGIGSAINNSRWTNLASMNNARICHFLRILRLLKLMNDDTNNKSPNCGTNPIIKPLPIPHNCCTYNNVCSTSSWCNSNKQNCEGNCAGKWMN